MFIEKISEIGEKAKFALSVLTRTASQLWSANKLMMSEMQKKKLGVADFASEKYPDFEKLRLRNSKWSPWF